MLGIITVKPEQYLDHYKGARHVVGSSHMG